MQESEIVRITEQNYLEFCKLIEWRRTGREEEPDLSRYQGERERQFFSKHDVLSSESFYVFAARCDGKFVGYLTAALIPKADPRLGTLYIDELWVASDYRHRGIAGLLVREALLVAKRLRLWRVRLTVSTDNDVARAFYRKWGFRESATCMFCELDVKCIPTNI